MLYQTLVSLKQGCLKGPLLFLVFINDIADGMTGLGRLFTDDTSIGHIANTRHGKFRFSLPKRLVKTLVSQIQSK